MVTTRSVKRPPTTVHQSSPLLSLPAELRNRIWEYVFDETVHIYQKPTGDLSSYLCHNTDHILPDRAADTDEADARVHNLSDSFLDRHIDSCVEDEHLFIPDGRILRTRKEGSYYALSDGLLRVCRSIHQETNLVLYRLTTFIFSGPDELTAFTTNISQTHRAAIESMVIAETWDFEVEASFVRKYPGLRRFQLFVSTTIHPPNEQLAERFWNKALARVARLPLTEARVTVYLGGRFNVSRLTDCYVETKRWEGAVGLWEKRLLAGTPGR